MKISPGWPFLIIQSHAEVSSDAKATSNALLVKTGASICQLSEVGRQAKQRGRKRGEE